MPSGVWFSMGQKKGEAKPFTPASSTARRGNAQQSFAAISKDTPGEGKKVKTRDFSSKAQIKQGVHV